MSESRGNTGARPVLLATRGGNKISRDDLLAHIATLLRLENVGVFLGSGASCGRIGGRTVTSVWKLFRENYPQSQRWLLEKSFLKKDVRPNLEKLLDSLEIAFQEWARLGWTRRLKELRDTRDDLRRAVISGALLREDFWEDSQFATASDEALNDHRRLLQRITASRQPGQSPPWVFTSNYDLAIEWAAESMGLRLTNGFEGLHARTFSPQVFDLGYHNLLAKGEARFGTYNVNLVKLHGSLSWQMVNDGSDDYTEIPAKFAWKDIEAFLRATPNAHFECPVVFPSAAKYLQTVGFVLGELMRRFVDFLSRPQTCLLVSGYSFSDDHINQFMLRALQNPTLQIVVFLPEAKEKDDLLDLADCSDWIKKLDSLKSPQLTVVGGGREAHFDRFVSLLPDPVIYDDQALEIRKALRDLRADRGEADEG